ncbi:hypothetical protein AVEN_22388-1 [Araneus ventricosus]|uniref:Uncharacterized protein n=1 Tax=Araneus ventricosus TaxID=182803 RepID=A0A4Y2PTD7_ARAVE|nr:hypothetical protein AVEN_22388-1 [Araneus ventricosus]
MENVAPSVTHSTCIRGDHLRGGTSVKTGTSRRDGGNEGENGISVGEKLPEEFGEKKEDRGKKFHFLKLHTSPLLLLLLLFKYVEYRQGKCGVQQGQEENDSSFETLGVVCLRLKWQRKKRESIAERCTDKNRASLFYSAVAVWVGNSSEDSFSDNMTSTDSRNVAYCYEKVWFLSSDICVLNRG